MLLNAEDWRREARRHLPRFVFDYVDGAADDGVCLRRNRSDLDAITLRPRVLRDTSAIDPSVTVFGRAWLRGLCMAADASRGCRADDGLARSAPTRRAPRPSRIARRRGKGGDRRSQFIQAQETT